jgi:ribosomal protein L11 methylase PrmA
VPSLDRLSQGLGSPNGSFLDVGVGTAGLAIAMANLWSSLKIVGIDPWAPSVTLALLLPSILALYATMINNVAYLSSSLEQITAKLKSLKVSRTASRLLLDSVLACHP